MPVYQVELPDGTTVGFDGQNPPTEQDYNELVASHASSQGPKTSQGISGDLEALLVGGGLNIPSSAAGLAGMGAGARITPGGPIPKLVGALAGGLIAGCRRARPRACRNIFRPDRYCPCSRLRAAATSARR